MIVLATGFPSFPCRHFMCSNWVDRESVTCWRFTIFVQMTPQVVPGPSSTRFGIDSTQLGFDSTQFGFDSTLFGFDSTQFGFDSTLFGFNSTQFGFNSTLFGFNSDLFGSEVWEHLHQ